MDSSFSSPTTLRENLLNAISERNIETIDYIFRHDDFDERADLIENASMMAAFFTPPRRRVVPVSFDDENFWILRFVGRLQTEFGCFIEDLSLNVLSEILRCVFLFQTPSVLRILREEGGLSARKAVEAGIVFHVLNNPTVGFLQELTNEAPDGWGFMSSGVVRSVRASSENPEEIERSHERHYLRASRAADANGNHFLYRELYTFYVYVL